MSVCLSVYLYVCAIAKHPLPEVKNTSGRRAYRLFWPAMTQFSTFSGKGCTTQGVGRDGDDTPWRCSGLGLGRMGLNSCRTWETVEEDWGWGSTCFWILLADYRGESSTALEALTSAPCPQQDAAGGTLKSAFLVCRYISSVFRSCLLSPN